MAIWATQYQRTAFDRTTSQVDKKMGAVTNLNLALVEIQSPVVTLLYPFDGPDQVVKHRAAYNEVRDRINAGFDAAEKLISTGASATTLGKARETWQAMDAAVRDAPDLIATGSVAAAFAKGVDVFKATVWDRYGAMTADFATLGSQIVIDIRTQTAAVKRVEQPIAPLVVGSLVLALMLAWRAARKMSRQILAPLGELRRAAMSMRDSDLDHVIELPGATTELQELAATINETTVSLRSSHGLLRDQANTDALTGLPNRKAFTERLHAMLAEPGGSRVGVLFIDLDDFKIVNDSLGHAAGDELLRIVAQRLRSSARAGEIVARLGGDEFAISLDCGDQPSTAITVAERVLGALQEQVTIGDTKITVGCSVGIATGNSGEGSDVADALLRNADFAMYMAKSQGKNRFEIFAPSMHAEMLGRTELKRDLAEACRLKQFVLHYQPVVDLSSGDVLGFEALIRWQHPTRGLLAPGEFITVAEDTGDIVDIGEWVIDQACHDLAAQHREAPDGSRLRMSVNVSAHQLTSPGFVAIVKSALDHHAIPAGALIIEITEGVAMTNIASATETLTQLRRHGVHIALDDFGTGFSSLRYLHELPIDIIKIDRSFVMDQEGKTDSMLEAIVTLGHSLGLGIVAEGIEQPSELERLRRLGHMAGQGYLIARPMPFADATEFLHSTIRATKRTHEATPALNAPS